MNLSEVESGDVDQSAVMGCYGQWSSATLGEHTDWWQVSLCSISVDNIFPATPMIPYWQDSCGIELKNAV